MTTTPSTVPARTDRPVSAHGRITPRRRRRRPLPRLLAWLALAAFLLITLFPFYWMLRIALSANSELAPHADSLVPVGTGLGAFWRVLGLSSIEEAQAAGGSGASINFGRELWNSILTSTVITLGRRSSARWRRTRSPGCAGVRAMWSSSPS